MSDYGWSGKNLQISHGSAYKIIFSWLGCHEVCARLALKQLTVLHNQTHLDICQEHLNRYGNECDTLGGIVSGDKTWIDHIEPESKWQCMEWKRP
jgi:hypothetical protein